MGSGVLLERRRSEARVGYGSATACALALVVVWVTLLARVPAGWPSITLNGIGYALSVVVLAGGYEALKRALRPFQSFLIMAATWLVVVVGVRGALLWLFG